MIISAAILLLIITPIFISMLLSLPHVQNRIVRFAAGFATDYLQTEVSIGEIDISATGHIYLKNFLVRDLDSDTLLYVHKLDSRLTGYNPTNNKLLLGESNVSAATLNLRQTTRGVMNIREITDKLTKKKGGGGKFLLNVESVALDQTRVRIEQLQHVNPEYGVDVKNIIINDIDGEVEDLTIDGSMIHAQIKRLDAQEESGFKMQNVSGELYLTQGALAITDAQLNTPQSSLTMPYIMLTDQRWADYKDFNTSTDLSFKVTKGELSTDDIAYFAPSMRDYDLTLRDLQITTSGEVNRMNIEIANATFGEASRLSAKAKLSGLPNFKEVESSILIDTLRTSAADIEMLSRVLTKKSLPIKAQDIVTKLGAIAAKGEISGVRGAESLDLDLLVKSDIGELETQMAVKLLAEQGVNLNGELSISQLNLGELLNQRDLGTTSFQSRIDGEIGEVLKFSTENHIYNLQYKGYNYNDIRFETRADSNILNGELTLNDPNIRLNMVALAWDLQTKEGESEPTEELMPKFDVSLDIEHANLARLGVNRRDSVSQLTAHLTARGEGQSIEHGRLRLELTDGIYRFNNDSISTSDALLTVESVPNRRRIDLDSDFLSMEFESSSSVKRITEYLKNSFAEYLPALYKEPRPMAMVNKSRIDQTSTLKVTTHNITPITNALVSDLEVAEESSLLLTFNEQSELFDLVINSDYVERESILAIGLSTHLTNRGDSLQLTNHIDELYLGARQLEGTAITATAKENKIALGARFENSIDSLAANIKSDLQLSRTESGAQRVFAEIKPSRISQGERVWSLKARGIDIQSGKIEIDRFLSESRNQRLLINGTASRMASDTVKMEMKNFDLSILSALIAQIGYEIEGSTNGNITASAALDNARLQSYIELDSVRVNHIPAPPMAMDVTWDSKLNRAKLLLNNRVTDDTLITGYYIPSEVKYYAKCEVDSLNMGLLDPPLGGVITDTKGYAHLDLTLQGQHREARLSGGIDIEQFETTIDYTKVKYSLPKGRIEVKDNLLQCRGEKIYDTQGGGGTLDLDVDLQHLSNISYSIRVLPQDMLVLNTTEHDNDTFYGELYCSGLAQISGDKRGVRMNITASSEDNSHFYMPLSSKEVAASADFITFVKSHKVDSLDEVAIRRRNFEKKRTSSAGSMVINMSLDVKPNTEVQLVIDPTVGDIIKARGEGQMNLSLEPKANKFEIYGDYTIDEGSYLFTLQNIVNKRFVINSGSSIQWTGSPVDARLNIDAIYKLKASLQPLIADESSRAVPVDCIIKLTERLTQPDVAFAIELPSSDAETQSMFNNLLNDQEAISRQFFYLMLANSFIPESAAGAADLGASAGAATGFELLTNQLSNWLSTSNYNVIIRYRPESELTGDELDVGFSKGLINNRLLVELEGNYITDNANTTSENVSNFMGEAYITWLIDRAGALRLKGFTQTIDRFDENQGLQETGIGVYYRESFNNFADLRDRVKARFKASDERIAKREDRRRRKKAQRNEKTDK